MIDKEKEYENIIKSARKRRVKRKPLRQERENKTRGLQKSLNIAFHKFMYKCYDYAGEQGIYNAEGFRDWILLHDITINDVLEDFDRVQSIVILEKL